MQRFALTLGFVLSISGAAGQVIIDTAKSPHAKLHPVPVNAVRLEGGFWEPRRKVNVERSIPTMLELLEEHGIVDNFRRLAGKKVPRRGPLYTDSDLYKWMEAVAYVNDPKWNAKFDELTATILSAQEPSGYLNTYYVEDKTKLRFTEMTRSHELYCLGHLLQAAIAYYRVTGNRRLLDGGIKFVDYIADRRPLLTGHPELEMALVELYRTTGNRKYLDLAAYLLSGVERETLKLRESDVKYMFSGKPFTSRAEFEGHAVRAMYASSGAADLEAETGDPAYRSTLDRLWTDLTTRKMYITGGVGSRSSGEAFGEAYELPNGAAYTESCAAIGNMMFNFRMLQFTGESKYADVIERALYNGVNSGVSLEGTLYCYRNPLASNGEKIRNPWYDTTCCPPNIQRVFASLPGYFYSTSSDGLYVHLYDNSVLDWHLEDGTPLRVTQTTRYPWEGVVELKIEPKEPREFTLHLRLPEWSSRTAVSVNGKAAQGTIRRKWSAGDVVRLNFDMRPQWMAANARIPEDNGKLAVQRGPLVYCLEQLDQKQPITDVTVMPTHPLDPEMRDGRIVVRHKGAYSSAEGLPLYAPWKPERNAAQADLLFIPYFSWANREPSAMAVWIPELR